MKELVEFTTDSSEDIYVEVELADGLMTGELEASGASEVLRRADRSFREAISLINPVASAIVEQIHSLAKAPQEMEVEFGLKLTAEAGAILASSSVEANIKVTLKWAASPSDNATE